MLLLALPAFATDYYLDGTLENDCDGTSYHYDVATRARHEGAGIIAWNDLASANAVLDAGDTLYMRGGTEDYEIYYIGQIDSATEGIHPDNFGSEGSPITYAVYSDEKVHFIGNYTASVGINISNTDYIRVIGNSADTTNVTGKDLKFSNLCYFLVLGDGQFAYPYGAGSDYCEVAYVEFADTNSTWETTQPSSGSSFIWHNASYNWLHHCSFYDMGNVAKASGDAGSGLNVGTEICGAGNDGVCNDDANYNVIEDNIFSHAGHHNVLLMNNHNVFRNNIVHNEQFDQSAVDSLWYSHRAIQMMAEYNEDLHHGYLLIEGNRVSHSSNNYAASGMGGSAIHLGVSNTILRYNEIYANAGNAMFLETQGHTTHGRVNYNHIYNNTFFANGYGSLFKGATYDLDPATKDGYNYRGAIPDRVTFYFVSNEANFPTMMYGNVLKNNIDWKAYGAFIVDAYDDGWHTDLGNCDGYAVCGDTIIDHNWLNANGTPDFVSEGSYGNPSIYDVNEWYWGETTPDGSDITTINTEPNFALKSTSGAIDGGTYLTTVTVVTDQDSITLDDAKYFQDGWGNGAGGGAVVAADYIAIGTVTNYAQISSINYDTGAIELVSAPSSTINVNDHVWLYKDSDGDVVLNGLAPDYGAKEFSGDASISGAVVTGGFDEDAVSANTGILYLDLTGTTWDETMGAENAKTIALLNGITSAQSEANGWNAVVKTIWDYRNVTRVSDTRVKIDLSAQGDFSSYNIASKETVTVNIDKSCVASDADIEASPTFVSPVAASSANPCNKGTGGSGGYGS